MTDDELDDLASRIARKLRDDGHVIPAVLPAHVGDAIAAAAEAGAQPSTCLIPLLGPRWLTAKWAPQPGGIITLKLSDWVGHAVWRGTFRPEAQHDR